MDKLDMCRKSFTLIVTHLLPNLLLNMPKTSQSDKKGVVLHTPIANAENQTHFLAFIVLCLCSVAGEWQELRRIARLQQTRHDVHHQATEHYRTGQGRNSYDCAYSVASEGQEQCMQEL